jgi:GWxTD domain-containing protein
MGLVMSFLLLAFALVAARPEVTERATQPVLQGLGNGTLTIMDVPENVPLEFYTVQCVSADSDAVSFSVKRSGEDAVPPTVVVGNLYQEVERGVTFRIDRGNEDFAAGDTFSFVTYPDKEELDKLFDRWMKRYVKWIISREERDRFESLEAPADKLAFMESFWRRRDITPETPGNETRKEHQRRFAYATQHFGAGIPGWATDRGKIYILLGAPSTINRNPAGRNSFERPSEIWTYNNAPNPRLPASFEIGFVDFTSTGRFEIVSADNIDVLAPLRTNQGWAMSELDALGFMRDGGMLMDPISGAQNQYFGDQMSMDQFDFQRNLLEVAKVPELNLPSLREVTEARADFPSVPLTTTAAFFPSEAGSAWVPISVSMPYARLTPRPTEDGTGYRYEADILIQVSDESGTEQPPIEDRIEIQFPVNDLDAYRAGQMLYEASVNLAPGTYQIESLVRDNPSGAVGRSSATIEVPVFTGEGLKLSSLLLASAAVETDPLPAGATRPPFQFGNLRLIPNVRHRFSRTSNLTAYVQALGYSLGPITNQARLRVDFFILKDGRLFSKVAPSYHRPSRKSSVAVMSEISLKALPPGSYTLRVRVTDENTEQVAERDADFTVTIPR